jgi:hypothetical protein
MNISLYIGIIFFQIVQLEIYRNVHTDECVRFHVVCFSYTSLGDRSNKHVQWRLFVELKLRLNAARTTTVFGGVAWSVQMGITRFYDGRKISIRFHEFRIHFFIPWRPINFASFALCKNRRSSNLRSALNIESNDRFIADNNEGDFPCF